ncbi:MAG: 4'-phosphopantetheinyl transferase superfamily protein [Bacteroidaceae bacterium]|nr:4'-phosphopantetheinyl transferase superfamily protein [Bacteroidaceae bacterium]
MDSSKSIFCINDHIGELGEAETERLIASLPEWRRETALRFRHLQGRRECAVGYIELLRGLRLCFGISGMPAFAWGEHDKPYLKDYPDIHFSISHCKEAAGCMVSERPCGLDIECIREAKESLVRYTMSPKEAEAIFSSPRPDIAFTCLWTQKEAVLKLMGTGLTDDLHHVLDPERLRGIEMETVQNPYRGYVVTRASCSSTTVVPIRSSEWQFMTLQKSRIVKKQAYKHFFLNTFLAECAKNNKFAP